MKEPILVFDKPTFVVRLFEEILEVDLKEGAKKELEDIVEATSLMRGSLGLLFQSIMPLDVALHKIDSAEVDSQGHLKVVVPLQRDITIPLEVDESRVLADELKRLVPSARARYGRLRYSVSSGTRTQSKR